MRWGVLGGAFAFVAWGCGDSTDEKLRAAKLAQGCAINSDCEDDLVCVFERCHRACLEDKDCVDPLRCVRGTQGETNVCQLEDEVGCERDKDCPGEQVCGVDQECRDACDDDEACVAGQICAASDECASTDPGKDQLDASGNILRSEGGVSGAPGAGGVGGAGGSEPSGGGSIGTGGAAMGGAPATASEAGAAAESGTGGDAAGGADPGPLGDYVESSDGVETVENDDRDHALPAPPRSSLFFTSGDEDWLKVSTPDDGRAHVLELELQQESGLRTGVEALAGADFASIGSTTTEAGVTTRIYVTVGPGATTLLRFWPFGGVPSVGKRLELRIQLSSEQDAHEPNGTPAMASSIAVNTAVTAQLIRPFVSATDQAPDDWYAVELTQGTATLELKQAPSGGRFAITRQDEDGNTVNIQTPLPGVTGAWPFSVPTAGRYLIRFAAYAGFVPFVQGAKPSYTTDSYVFEVKQ